MRLARWKPAVRNRRGGCLWSDGALASPGLSVQRWAPVSARVQAGLGLRLRTRMLGLKPHQKRRVVARRIRHARFGQRRADRIGQRPAVRSSTRTNPGDGAPLIHSASQRWSSANQRLTGARRATAWVMAARIARCASRSDWWAIDPAECPARLDRGKRRGRASGVRYPPSPLRSAVRDG